MITLKRIFILTILLCVLLSQVVFAAENNDRWKFITDIYDTNDGTLMGKEYLDTQTVKMEENILYAWIRFDSSNESIQKAINSAYSQGYSVSQDDVQRISYTEFAFNVENKTFKPVLTDPRFNSLPEYYQWKNIEDGTTIGKEFNAACEEYLLQTLPQVQN